MRRAKAEKAKINQRKAELQASRREVEELWEFERSYPVSDWRPAFAVLRMYPNVSSSIVHTVNRLCSIFDATTSSTGDDLPHKQPWESDWIIENRQYTVLLASD